MRGMTIIVAAVCMAGVAAPARAVDFAHEVVPLLTKHCGECHAGDARQGGFSMNTRDDVLERWIDEQTPWEPASRSSGSPGSRRGATTARSSAA